jgi:hypothetical protein
MEGDLQYQQRQFDSLSKLHLAAQSALKDYPNQLDHGARVDEVKKSADDSHGRLMKMKAEIEGLKSRRDVSS